MFLHRAFRRVPLALAAVALAAAFWGCGDSPTATGYGTLSVQLQFDQGFGTAASAALAPAGEDLTPTDRTLLSDLIITFDRVEAWSCPYDTMEAGDGEGMEVETARRVLFAADDTTEIEEGDDDHDGDCVSYVVADSTITLSVAGLDTTLTQLLGVAELPAGDYSRLVLRLTDAKVVTQAGDTVQAALPGDSDRLKVNSPFTISEDTVTDVVIVFDLYRSIVENPPGSMNFKIKPVLHAHQGWYEDD
jgi:hypothetical protein